MTRQETVIRARELGLRVRDLSVGICIEGAAYSEGEYYIGVRQLSAFCDWVEKELGHVEIAAGGQGYLSKRGCIDLPFLKSIGIPSEDSLYTEELGISVKSLRGGSRKGSGRKPGVRSTNTVHCCAYVQPETLARLRYRSDLNKTTIGMEIDKAVVTLGKQNEP